MSCAGRRDASGVAPLLEKETKGKGARKRNREVEARCKHEQQACAWPLQLNAVLLELATAPPPLQKPPTGSAARASLARDVDRFGRAEILCQRYLRDAVAPPRAGRLWRLYAHVRSAEAAARAAAGDASAAVAVGDASGASRRLLEFNPCSEEMSAVAVWQARVSSAASPAAATRYEAWHGLLLSAARSRDQALAILALAACEHAPPGDTAQLAAAHRGAALAAAAPPPRPRSLRRCRPPR